MKDLRTAIQYGFILGLAIAILFLPYKDIQRTNDGAYIDYVVPLEYIVNVLRIGIGGGLVGAISYLINSKKKSNKNKKI